MARRRFRKSANGSHKNENKPARDRQPAKFPEHKRNHEASLQASHAAASLLNPDDPAGYLDKVPWRTAAQPAVFKASTARMALPLVSV